MDNEDQKFIMTVDNFSGKAHELSSFYQSRFEKPLHASEDRFQWDYWHVPGQYTVVRTPAYNYFPEELFDSLKSELEDWGLKNLGCGEISPTWLSYYVDGCEQLFHADNPHGPWAFVFSLTDWENRQFTGGETKLLSEQVLSYWHGFDSEKGFEENTLLKKVESHFNRLIVFDPRVPHGVETVHGEKDPRKARIVIHGWFLDPLPIVTGGLENIELSDVLGAAIEPVLDDIESRGHFNGYVGLRVKISSYGSVTDVHCIQNTLRNVNSTGLNSDIVFDLLKNALAKCQFPQSEEPSNLTLPLVFK